MQWEADEQHGRAAKTPHELFRWNQLGDLYAWFTATYAPLSLAELKTMLRKNIDEIYTMIDSMPDAELFEPHGRRWADDATKNGSLAGVQVYPRQHRCALWDIQNQDPQMEKGSTANFQDIAARLRVSW